MQWAQPLRAWAASASLRSMATRAGHPLRGKAGPTSSCRSCLPLRSSLLQPALLNCSLAQQLLLQPLWPALAPLLCRLVAENVRSMGVIPQRSLQQRWLGSSGSSAAWREQLSPTALQDLLPGRTCELSYALRWALLLHQPDPCLQAARGCNPRPWAQHPWWGRSLDHSQQELVSHAMQTAMLSRLRQEQLRLPRHRSCRRPGQLCPSAVTSTAALRWSAGTQPPRHGNCQRQGEQRPGQGMQAAAQTPA